MTSISRNLQAFMPLRTLTDSTNDQTAFWKPKGLPSHYRFLCLLLKRINSVVCCQSDFATILPTNAHFYYLILLSKSMTAETKKKHSKRCSFGFTQGYFKRYCFGFCYRYLIGTSVACKPSSAGSAHYTHLFNQFNIIREIFMKAVVAGNSGNRTGIWAVVCWYTVSGALMCALTVTDWIRLNIQDRR